MPRREPRPRPSTLASLHIPGDANGPAEQQDQTQDEKHDAILPDHAPGVCSPDRQLWTPVLAHERCNGECHPAQDDARHEAKHEPVFQRVACEQRAGNGASEYRRDGEQAARSESTSTCWRPEPSRRWFRHAGIMPPDLPAAPDRQLCASVCSAAKHRQMSAEIQLPGCQLVVDGASETMRQPALRSASGDIVS
jgi:hypothetical protein